MADLDWGVALNLAGSLVTIGHPYQKAAIEATAQDLTKWCRGAIIEGRVWNPEAQAQAIVDEARMWDSWPDGGTKQLRALFLAKFGPKGETQQGWKPLSFDEAVARGLILPPCGTCDDRLTIGQPPEVRYCLDCPAGRHMAKWEGDRGLRRLNNPPVARPTRDFATATPITPEQMTRALEDEQRRRREQQPLLSARGVD